MTAETKTQTDNNASEKTVRKRKPAAAADRHPMNVMLDAGYVQKDKTNTFHKYKYASDETVTRSIRDHMMVAGVYVKSCEIKSFVTDRIETMDGKGSKKVQTAVSVHVSFMLADADKNEYGPYEGVGSAFDTGDKAAMRAMTAARKYAISQCCLVSWGDDPEAFDKVDESTAGGLAPSTAHDGSRAPLHEPVPKNQQMGGDEMFDAAKCAMRIGTLNTMDELMALWGELTPQQRNAIKPVFSERRAQIEGPR